MVRKRRHPNILRRASERLDDVVEIVSPQMAYRRKLARFGYDIIQSHRLNKKRTGLSGTGDQHLSEANLDKLREICRDLSRNNPLVKGLYRKEANGAIGTETQIQARSDDEIWNRDAEQLWAEEMVHHPCDVTGTYNFHLFLKNLFKSYRRDGDAFVLFSEYGLQAIEGEQVGTPYGKKSVIQAEHFDVTNGVAVSKKTKRIIGYYVGTPNKWGYIQPGSFKNYASDLVHHVMNPERFSHSRGEPVLISAVDIIDKLWGYVDAELVAAKVNACFTMFVTSKADSPLPPPFTGGISSTGTDAEGNRLEKMLPGTIMYGNSGEDARGIGAARPASAFDPFVLRMLAIIGSPMCMALMLVTGDFSGATFMNARIAYQEVRDNWIDEQNLIVKPFVRRLWLLKLLQWFDDKKLKPVDGWGRHEILCKRWPYVDPYKEAMADKIQLENGTTTRTMICARQGHDFKELLEQRAREDQAIQEAGVTLVKEKPNAVPK